MSVLPLEVHGPKHEKIMYENEWTLARFVKPV